MTEVVIELNLPDWSAARERILSEVPGLIAATLQTQRGMIFDQSGAYNGRPAWPDLRCRNGMPLKDRGTLAQSIAPRNDGLRPGRSTGTILRTMGGLDGITTVGSSLAYASVQNNGATIVPVRARALRFKCHGRWVFRKKVVIPPRPFADWTHQDQNELVTTVENYVKYVLEVA